MFQEWEERLSDSPLVDRVWRARSDEPGAFTSVSTALWSMVIAKSQGRVSMSFHGPETAATLKDFPPGAEWFGISFKLGTFVPGVLPATFLDRFVVLPAASARSFSLCRSSWEFPSFENADTFVGRLVRAGLLEHEPAGDPGRGLSLRAEQYRFVRSTGLSRRTVRQIERARRAAVLLRQGLSILDTVYEAGYSDQPHLTRSLRRFIGHTPAEIPSTPLIALDPS